MVIPLVVLGTAITSVLEDIETKIQREQVHSTLRTASALEAERIANELETMHSRLSFMLSIEEVRQALDAYIGDRSDANKQSLARIVDQMPSMAMELDGLVIVELDGTIVAATDPNQRQPLQSVIDRAAQGPAFGPARRDDSGVPILPVAVPYVGSSGRTELVAICHCDLQPIIDMVATHEGAGETSEAHLAQRDAGGDAQFITPLRFMPDAAFNLTIPKERTDMPIVQALYSVEDPGIVEGILDYRQEPTVAALRTIGPTGWALVVKLDVAEAYAGRVGLPIELVAALVLILASIGALGVGLFSPLGRRLHKITETVDAIRRGDYHRRINDTNPDEIGMLARAFDQVTADLVDDIDRRRRVEALLEHRALHDPLTALPNRALFARRARSRARPPRTRGAGCRAVL